MGATTEYGDVKVSVEVGVVGVEEGVEVGGEMCGRVRAVK